MNRRADARMHSIRSLRHAFVGFRLGEEIDERGYVGSFDKNLLSFVSVDDFEADLRSGDGNELETKFRAVHSSSALAVNCFAPFRSRLSDLRLPSISDITALEFERKCPTGLRGGRSPNLDVLVSNKTEVVGIESKLTEYLQPHTAKFSQAYIDQIMDDRRDQAYFREMLRLIEVPDHYRWLDAAQLIKHAFGLARTFRGKSICLCYLFWEPENHGSNPAFAEHRAEVAEFADRVAGSTPSFFALSYPELWASWRKGASPWLAQHQADLNARYLVNI